MNSRRDLGGHSWKDIILADTQQHRHFADYVIAHDFNDSGQSSFMGVNLKCAGRPHPLFIGRPVIISALQMCAGHAVRSRRQACDTGVLGDNNQGGLRNLATWAAVCADVQREMEVIQPTFLALVRACTVVTSGDRFRESHNACVKRTSIDLDVRSIHNPKRLALCGLDAELQSAVMGASAFWDVMLTAICLLFAAAEQDVPFHVYCTSGRHRSVTIAELLRQMFGVTVDHTCLRFINLKRFEGCRENLEPWLGVTTEVVACLPPVRPLAERPWVHGSTPNLARGIGVCSMFWHHLTATVATGTAKSARKRANKSAYVFTTPRNLLRSLLPGDEDYECVGRDQYAANSLSLANWVSEAEVSGITVAEVMTPNLDRVVTVAGGAGEQRKHLRDFLLQSDESDMTSYDWLRPIFDFVARRVFPTQVQPPDDIDSSVLNLESSCGFEFQHYNPGVSLKGQVLDAILQRARLRIEALKMVGVSGSEFEYGVMPGIQSCGGRGKRVKSERLHTSKSDALGRLIRISAPDDVVIASTILERLCKSISTAYQPTALGYSFLGGQREFLKNLKLLVPTAAGLTWSNTCVGCPDAIKFDANIQRGLTACALKALFARIAHADGLIIGVDRTVMLDYMICCHTSAPVLVGKTLSSVETGLSSGSSFVSIIESIISIVVDTLARLVREFDWKDIRMHLQNGDFDDLTGLFDHGDASALGDDVVTTDSEVETDVYEASLRFVAEKLHLKYHPLTGSKAKGIVGHGPYAYEYLSRILISECLSMRPIDDSVGALFCPERCTANLSHLVLRMCGLLVDSIFSPYVVPLLSMIKSTSEFIDWDPNYIERATNAAAQDVKNQHIFSLLENAGVTPEQLFSFLQERTSYELYVAALNLNYRGKFESRRPTEAEENDMCRGWLGLPTKSRLLSEEQVTVGYALLSRFLWEHGHQVLARHILYSPARLEAPMEVDLVNHQNAVALLQGAAVDVDALEDDIATVISIVFTSGN
jgi:hypothetical protein